MTEYVYFVLNHITENVKIGRSERPQDRLKTLQSATDCPLTLVATVEGDAQLERHYHTVWHAFRVQGEWFSIDVEQTDSGLQIIGRKTHRPALPRHKVRRSHKLCVRLNDRQRQLIRDYMEVRGFQTEVDAMRYMVDGLESFLQKRHLLVEDE